MSVQHGDQDVGTQEANDHLHSSDLTAQYADDGVIDSVSTIADMTATEHNNAETAVTDPVIFSDAGSWKT